MSHLPPLCVDLDNTLVATDTLWESILLLLKTHPLHSLLLPFWLLKGRAYFKHQIARYVTLDVTLLPYRQPVLEFIQAEAAQGRRLILATAAHYSIAEAVAKHLALFSEVVATDEQTNMKGRTKGQTLSQRFSAYDYIGDCDADLPVLQGAQRKFVVGTRVLKQLNWVPTQTFELPKLKIQVWLKLLRAHQWVKNSLIFLPLLFSHQFFDATKLQEALIAVIAFSLAASSGYILNDLLDLAADRAHPTKKHRPFAAGLIPVQWGLPLILCLIGISMLISIMGLPSGFIHIVLLYLLITITYSFYFKNKLILDVLILAGLYTLRIFAGGLAVTVTISSWLLAFSMFIFISLAFLKRYTELLQLEGQATIKGRDYQLEDQEMIASMGPASGYLAVLVFSLYISSEQVEQLYNSAFILWLICPLLLYWISRIWFLAHRGIMLDDPVQFALMDKASWFTIVCILVFIVLAKSL